jgi:hypothetical protein
MRIAISGHRGLPAATERLIDQDIRQQLADYRNGELVGISNLADGADQVFAQAVLDAGGQLEVIVPAAQYRAGLPETAHAAYDALLARAAKVGPGSPSRYLASGRRGRLRYSHDVKVRLLALGLAAWVALYAWVYVEGMRDQGSTPYWWYLAIIGGGAVPPLLAAVGLRSRSMLICGAVILAVAAVLALPSTGMLLLPGVIAAATLAVLSPRSA